MLPVPGSLPKSQIILFSNLKSKGHLGGTSGMCVYGGGNIRKKKKVLIILPPRDLVFVG